MDEYILYPKTTIKNHMDKIRAKTGKTDALTLSAAADEIENFVTEPKLQEKTITANGTYSADEGFDGISKVTVDVASSGSSQTIVTTDSVTITNADVTVEDESTIVLGG